MAAQELASTPLLSKLTHYYKGENANDSVGSNNLTNNNTVVFNPGLFNNAFDFGASNTNKRMSFAGNNGYTGGAFSISWWMKLQTEVQAGNDYYPIMIGDSTSNSRLDFFYEYNGGSRQIRAGRTRTGTSNDFIPAYSVTLGISTWHNFINAYDGTNGTIYMDGVSIGTYASSGNGASAEASVFDIGSSTVPGNFTSALIDDVGLFGGYKITATDALNIYNGFPLSGGSFLMNFV